jgi:GNAT superfamily N-acetyltransferase
MRQPVLRPAHPRDFPFCEHLYFAEMDHIITQLGLDMARQRESFARQWHVAEVRIITMSGEDIGWLQTKTSDSTLFLGQLYLSVHMQRQGIGTRVLQMLIEEARRAGKPITPWCGEDQPSAPPLRALGLSAHARRPAQGLYAAGDRRLISGRVIRRTAGFGAKLLPLITG